MAYAADAVAVMVEMPTRSASTPRLKISFFGMKRHSVSYPLSRRIVARRMPSKPGQHELRKDMQVVVFRLYEHDFLIMVPSICKYAIRDV